MARNTYSSDPTLDIDGVRYFTERLAEIIEKIEQDDIDLSDYVKKAELEEELKKIDIDIDLSDYVLSTDLAEALKDYALKTDLMSTDEIKDLNGVLWIGDTTRPNTVESVFEYAKDNFIPNRIIAFRVNARGTGTYAPHFSTAAITCFVCFSSVNYGWMWALSDYSKCNFAIAQLENGKITEWQKVVDERDITWKFHKTTTGTGVVSLPKTFSELYVVCWKDDWNCLTFTIPEIVLKDDSTITTGDVPGGVRYKFGDHLQQSTSSIYADCITLIISKTKGKLVTWWHNEGSINPVEYTASAKVHWYYR